MIALILFVLAPILQEPESLFRSFLPRIALGGRLWCKSSSSKSLHRWLAKRISKEGCCGAGGVVLLAPGCSALETILERSAYNLIVASMTFVDSSWMHSGSGLGFFWDVCFTPQGLKNSCTSSFRGFGLVLNTSTTSLMRLASTDKPSAAVFAFSHESTSAMERHVIGGRAALSEASCAALLADLC